MHVLLPLTTGRSVLGYLGDPRVPLKGHKWKEKNERFSKLLEALHEALPKEFRKYGLVPHYLFVQIKGEFSA